ncbi:hypothetical protein GGX14DRAFT_594061 [Mycena pura]|uniref:Uncharacterized protein n=1 Tax=Mycena pura TaxID=153505 RepID=A0AAD6UR19_9AGAR|nr:hypothetical protein GGX14DRAFT_594061 [Mycena pura]
MYLRIATTGNSEGLKLSSLEIGHDQSTYPERSSHPSHSFKSYPHRSHPYTLQEPAAMILDSVGDYNGDIIDYSPYPTTAATTSSSPTTTNGVDCPILQGCTTADLPPTDSFMSTSQPPTAYLPPPAAATSVSSESFTGSPWSYTISSSSPSASANGFADYISIISSLPSQSTSYTLSLSAFSTAPAPPPSDPPPSALPSSATSSPAISSPATTHVAGLSAIGSRHVVMLIIGILVPVLVTTTLVAGFVVYRCRRRRTTSVQRTFSEMRENRPGSRTSTFFSPPDPDAQSCANDSAVLLLRPETTTPAPSAAMLPCSGWDARWQPDPLGPDTRPSAAAIMPPRHRPRPFRSHRQPSSSSYLPGPVSASEEKKGWPDEKSGGPVWHPAIGARWQPFSSSTRMRAPTIITVDPTPRSPPPNYWSWRPLPRLPVGVAQHTLSTVQNAF